MGGVFTPRRFAHGGTFSHAIGRVTKECAVDASIQPGVVLLGPAHAHQSEFQEKLLISSRDAVDLQGLHVLTVL